MNTEQEILEMYGGLTTKRDSDEVYVGDAVFPRNSSSDIPIGVVLQISDDGSAIINLSNSGTIVSTVVEDEEIPPTCEKCKSETVYSDKEEEWVCPFCEL